MSRAFSKSEIRNPKSERSPKSEQCSDRSIRISGFGLLSDFGLRISDFILVLLFVLTAAAHAHIGSPDVFYDGMAGPYPARITIRMPSVIPGRAEISVRVQTDQPVEVSFLPLYAHTAVSNAPPPDPGLLVSGETN